VDTSFRRREAQMAVLDMFTSATGIPITLYELHNGGFVDVVTERSLANFEPHCQVIQNYYGGKDACAADQCHRAHLGIHSHEDQLTVCWAGMCNQVTPIEVEGEVRAVLLYGEMQVEGEEYQQKALEHHRQAVMKLNLDKNQAVELRQLQLKAKKYTLQQLEDYKAMLRKVVEVLYTFWDEEDQLRRNVEQVSHEIQTRLQGVVAEAENLAMEVTNISLEETQQRVNKVLYSALALDTVTQTLGEYLEEYHFRPQSIAGLLHEAVRLYEPEANRRGIDIYLRLQREDGRSPLVEISRSHLQHAINNLLHNAVKYSFRSGPNSRHRFILIKGEVNEDNYTLTIENYGVGIQPEEIANGDLFRDGYKGKLTHEEYRTGAGKGLYFTKRVIDSHQGRIVIESELKTELDPEDEIEGKPHLNRFIIYLPRKQPKEGSIHAKNYRLD
jgi:signal transduction histidine kinase